MFDVIQTPKNLELMQNCLKNFDQSTIAQKVIYSAHVVQKTDIRAYKNGVDELRPNTKKEGSYDPDNFFP